MGRSFAYFKNELARICLLPHISIKTVKGKKFNKTGWKIFSDASQCKVIPDRVEAFSSSEIDEAKKWLNS